MDSTERDGATSSKSAQDPKVQTRLENDGKNTKALVVANWLLVAATFLGVWISYHFMGLQAELMRQSTDLAWKPFALVSMNDSTMFDVWYAIAGMTPDSAELRPLDSVPIGSDGYRARKSAMWLTRRSVQLVNAGKTPLVFKGRIMSTMSASEWNEKFRKKPDELVSWLRSNKFVSLQEVDIVIMPGDSFPVRNYGVEPPFAQERTIDLETFEKARDSTHQLRMYPYVFIEYSDSKGNPHNVLNVQFVVGKVDTISGHSRFVIDQVGIEVYRWDIGIE